MGEENAFGWAGDGGGELSDCANRIGDLAVEDWPEDRARDLRGFAVGVLERHLERRLRSAAGLV